MVFWHCRAKIERANEHIRNIERRIRRLEESYTADLEIHPEGGYKYIKYDLADTSARIDISVLIGDALHNLKCALDYAWIHTLRMYAPSAITDKTQFPAYTSGDLYEAALKRAEIHTLCPPLFEAMVTKIKLYAGGDDAAVLMIKKLNILDKHRLLLPLITYTSISGLQMDNERGEPQKGFCSATMEPPPWFVRIPEGWCVKDKGKPSVALLFDEATPVHYLDAPDRLAMYSAVTRQVVEMLEVFP